MTGTPKVSDATKLVAEPVVSPDEAAAWPPPERHKPNVYAAYWRDRSGFFTAPVQVDHSPDRSAHEQHSAPDQ
jgi:hypothetical protein